MLTFGLLGLLIRATILMGLGLIAAKLTERRSASLSHRILAATSLCVVLLPFISGFAPQWEWARPSWLAIDEPAFTSPSSPAETIVSVRVEVPQGASPHLPDAAAIGLLWNWESTWASLWLFGSCLMSIRLSLGLLRLRSSLVRSREAPIATIYDVQSVARSLGIRQPVQIRFATNEAMPMVCWFGKWVLVLPSNFDTWDDELKQATISHELGHIARFDGWVDYGIQFLLCILWWHPLAWMTARSVTRLRELACDEWVLQSSGVSPRSYAHSLLEVVRKCHIDYLQLATPMASQDELESRIRNITSPNRSRRVGRVWLVLSAVGIAIVAGGIAIVTLVNKKSQGEFQNAAGVFGEEQPPSDRGGSTITGLVTHDGTPVSGIKLKLIKTPEGQPNQLHAIVSTDTQGRYSISGMHPGERYYFEVEAKGELMVRNWQFQSPYVVAVGGKEGDTIELPEAKMVSNTQVLKGVVVDPAGKPVPGVSVTANLASGGMLTRTSAGQAPWTQTDQQGRFQLSNLPEETIELKTHKPNPAGGRILHPSKLVPEINSKDIRIVFDPSLGTGIEDLDAK